MTKPFWIECCVPSFMVVEQDPLIWIKPGMSAPVRHPTLALRATLSGRRAEEDKR
ncbi:hypothetical protein ACT4MK_45640 [Bradyrhizobium barranii]|uniref:hypothetical protein n=1 Tax=Bradyrhizobium TaxID=374 RepID=UPI003F1F37E0